MNPLPILLDDKLSFVLKTKPFWYVYPLIVDGRYEFDDVVPHHKALQSSHASTAKDTRVVAARWPAAVVTRATKMPSAVVKTPK